MTTFCRPHRSGANRAFICGYRGCQYLLSRPHQLGAASVVAIRGCLRRIRKEFRSRHWVAVALQLGFVGMTGTTLRSLEYLPAAVLRHLGPQFRQPVPDIATLRMLYRRRRTRFAHQRWAVQQWGLRKFDPAIEQRLTEHLHSRTHATLSRGRREQAAREWLYRAYVAIPRSRTITVLVGSCDADHRRLHLIAQPAVVGAIGAGGGAHRRPSAVSPGFVVVYTCGR
jgi:Domain of unknown function (DUF4158)